jgi:hypothetical protein
MDDLELLSELVLLPEGVDGGECRVSACCRCVRS